MNHQGGSQVTLTMIIFLLNNKCLPFAEIQHFIEYLNFKFNADFQKTMQNSLYSLLPGALHACKRI